MSDVHRYLYSRAYLTHNFWGPIPEQHSTAAFSSEYYEGILKNANLEEPADITGTERWRSISDLRKLGPSAVEYLIINLWDSDKKVRLAAVDALGEIGDQRAYEHLVRMLGDPDHDVRFACVVALGTMGDARAIKPLSEACKDKNGFVRTIALEMMEKLKARQSS
jgi:HEAT repeat protein